MADTTRASCRRCPGRSAAACSGPWVVSLEEHLSAWHWDGCHANAAGARGPRTARHNGVNELIASGMRTVGWSAQAKEIQLADRPKVRGDLVARNWQSGEGTVVGDTTIWCPMQRRLVKQVARGRLVITDKAEKSKRDDKEALCKRRNWKFYPFALNTFGGFGTFLYEFFTDAFGAKRDAAAQAGEPEWKVILEKKSLYEDISAEVQRGNYAMFKENSVGMASGALQRVAAADVEMEAQHPE